MFSKLPIEVMLITWIEVKGGALSLCTPPETEISRNFHALM